jgi:hypothetical protein
MVSFQRTISVPQNVAQYVAQSAWKPESYFDLRFHFNPGINQALTLGT